MRPIYFNFTPATTATSTGPVVLDSYIAPGNVTVSLTVRNAGASLTAVLEYTADDVLNVPSANLFWQPFTASPFSATGSVTVNNGGVAEAMFAYAPRAVRVRVSAIASGAPNFSVAVTQLGLAGT